MPGPVQSSLRACLQTTVAVPPSQQSPPPEKQDHRKQHGVGNYQVFATVSLAVGLLLTDDLAALEVQVPPSAASIIQQMHSQQRNPLSGTWDTNPQYRLRLNNSVWELLSDHRRNGPWRAWCASGIAIELEGFGASLCKRKLLSFYANVAEFSKVLIERSYRHVFGCSSSGD